MFLRLAPLARRDQFQRGADQAWTTLGGYLRGVLMLGAIEGVIIGVTLAIVGSELVIPMALLTFVAAFVPVVGAIAAGVAAVLVALVTVGPGSALLVAVAALAVQQFDNDLLAPVIDGRALQLHAVVVLLSVTTGAKLFGFAGTVLADRRGNLRERRQRAARHDHRVVASEQAS